MFVVVHQAPFRLSGMNSMARVEAELRARGETLASFAARLGVRSQDINNWKRRGIPRTKQTSVAEALGWSLDQLLTGKTVAPDQPNRPQAEQSQADQPNSHVMSTAGRRGAADDPSRVGFGVRETRDGDPSEYAPWLPRQRLALHQGQVVMIEERHAPVAFPADWLQRQGLREETLALYQAEGDSMAPLIRAGDILLIDRADCDPAKGGVFLLHDGRRLIIRRIDIDYDGAWILRSDNLARYPDRRVASAMQQIQVKVIGRVDWRGGEINA
ncbi:MAG: S24 family peptidase [Lamprobacter sp.]|uniref:S24 family peptidase n=1 Tax=Lamprobacter sp. TaxID=3100796 RepID=UPI002B2624C5|nr:S24 family peptidase [Lamprobacter sp.]MEA3643513.1 S24 family peptidase [Lamprobacter sp.]